MLCMLITQALADVVYEVASHAHIHLEHARHLLDTNKSRLPPNTNLSFLSSVRTIMYLEALQKGGFNIMDEHTLQPKSHFWYQLRLLYTKLRGKPLI